MDNGLPLALIAQLDSVREPGSQRAAEELRSRIDTGEIELEIPFLSALAEHAAQVDRPTWSLRLLTETIWFADDTIGFLYPERYWSSSEGEHGLIMSSLRSIVSQHSAVAATNDHEWATTYAYASGLVSGDRLSLLELDSLRQAECLVTRDTASISRALRAHWGDAQPNTAPEARMASALEAGLTQHELTDDTLLSFLLPYQGLHGGGAIGKHLVWFRSVVAIALSGDPAYHKTTMARIAEVAPQDVQRSAIELYLRSP